LTLSKTAITSSRDLPSSHAAPVTLKTVTQPQIPRRMCSSSGDAEAMSSVTTACIACRSPVRCSAFSCSPTPGKPDGSALAAKKEGLGFCRAPLG